MKHFVKIGNGSECASDFPQKQESHVFHSVKSGFVVKKMTIKIDFSQQMIGAHW